MRGKKEVIEVAVGHPEDPMPTYRERDAKVYGPLALLPTVKWDGWEGRHEGWTITHVNTGYAIGPSIPDRANALRAIYLLKDEDWSFRHRSHAPPGLRDRVITVLQDVTAKPYVHRRTDDDLREDGTGKRAARRRRRGTSLSRGEAPRG